MEINKYSPYLTRYKNVPVDPAQPVYQDFYTPILVVEPPRDMVFVVDPKEKLVLKLYDANGNEFPPSAKLRVSVQAAGADSLPIPIGKAVYGPWQRLPYTDQIDERKNAALVFYFPALNNRPFAIREGEKLLLEVNAPVAIDWDQNNPGLSVFAIDLDMLTLAEAQRRALLAQRQLLRRQNPALTPIPPARR
ncbi:hypothetical protein [Thermus scotoductus]|uniref:Uncharacterized protein n=1 Tax=Thermus scotoductus TaxID=37636 RepID=A0A430QZ52_THESC|nr:hypothetical protein [Thermus scotoductus]RTG94846.1 hypothetical protein CSW49_08210 [Thermus scotoductus]RTH00450.1 hypothetical protein CSW45_13530 [Thermus scotoductus]RTH16032.1 hypothetical protein CSW42_13810 [Thermus scotoductus]RTH96118.1 hypothetical protein CSW28_13900 [Thermus scotoductus]RTI17583.1 hypothetical protein CSW21_13215 [Thermus scotoductus]